MNNSDNDKVVERIFSLWDQGIKDETAMIKTIAAEFNLEETDAESFYELTQAGYLRAGFISQGKSYPKNNLNENPIVLSALKIGLYKLGHSELFKIDIKPKRPWWKFW